MKSYRFLGREGRITIPLEIREYLDLEDRDLLSFTVEDDAVVIRREDVCNNCAEGKEEAFEDFFDRLPVELQQQLVTKLAKRLLKNQRGAAYGRHYAAVPENCRTGKASGRAGCLEIQFPREHCLRSRDRCRNQRRI